VAVLQIHGTADDVVAFGGGRVDGIGAPGGPMASYPGAEKTAAMWANNDGCAVVPSAPAQRVDVDADLADGGQAPEAHVKRWAGCRPGGAVELWTIPNGSHAPNLSSAFPGAALDFLAAHPKP
jgi:polyhydroxybutyrate depolymerase